MFEEYYLTTTPKYLSSVANQQEYTLDSSLIKINRVEINYKPSDTNSKPIRALAIKLDELPRYLADNSLGGSGIFNAGYYVIGSQSSQKIGFVPIPTEAGTNNISTWGIQAPDDLSSSSDNVNIPYPDRFASLIELKAASYLLRKGQQEEVVAARYMQDYLGGVARMKTFLKERQSDGANVIQDLLLEDVAFDYPL